MRFRKPSLGLPRIYGRAVFQDLPGDGCCARKRGSARMASTATVANNRSGAASSTRKPRRSTPTRGWPSGESSARRHHGAQRGWGVWRAASRNEASGTWCTCAWSTATTCAAGGVLSEPGTGRGGPSTSGGRGHPLTYWPVVCTAGRTVTWTWTLVQQHWNPPPPSPPPCSCPCRGGAGAAGSSRCARSAALHGSSR
jgi:hypothetical protein